MEPSAGTGSSTWLQWLALARAPVTSALHFVRGVFGSRAAVYVGQATGVKDASCRTLIRMAEQLADPLSGEQGAPQEQHPAGRRISPAPTVPTPEYAVRRVLTGRPSVISTATLSPAGLDCQHRVERAKVRAPGGRSSMPLPVSVQLRSIALCGL